VTARTFTHPSVLQGIADGAEWADPVMNPADIDWPARQARAAIPFKVIDGRPVNPCGSTGIRYGRNEFGHWGEALMADALVTVTLGGTRHLLMVERGDGHGWAVPGGHVEAGETRVVAASRELQEETALVALPGDFRVLAARYVPDPRASDEAWAVTVPCVTDCGHCARLPWVAGRDDARRAEWVPARSYTVLASAVGMLGGRVFAAHVPMLTEFLGAAGATETV
jgi:ADP-ribose pyrophosphatase